VTLIKDLAAMLAKYRGTSDMSDKTAADLEETLRHVVEAARPYKVAKVEFLLPADADIDKLYEILSNMQNDHFNDPIAEWRLPCHDVTFISGPEAEGRFDQPDLEYPGKQEYDLTGPR